MNQSGATLYLPRPRTAGRGRILALLFVLAIGLAVGVILGRTTAHSSIGLPDRITLPAGIGRAEATHLRVVRAMDRFLPDSH